jgi:polyvinyl alcohol dehydrogenase (cytochrome)
LRRTFALVWLIVKRQHMVLFSVGLVILLCAFPGYAQEKEVATPALQGQGLFIENCSNCHKNANEAPKARSQQTLMHMTPEAVLAALTTGPMAVQGQSLTDPQKRLIAIYLGGRPLGSAEAGDAKTMPNRCASNPDLGDPLAGAAWNGWGVDIANTRFQPAKGAGLSASDVPQLKLKWAFGFPNGIHAYGQPTVAGGRVFVGSDTSFVYSLDARTGCIYWSYLAQTGVRTAISIGPVRGQGSAKFAIYFGDERANVYAVNAATGELIWKVLVDDHALARITGAPKLYEDRLYVPVSVAEETVSSNLHYPCCTFRGSVVALNANTGQPIWKSYTIPERPKPVRKNSVGTQLWAPAGAAIWLSPTIDPKRRAIYVGTGDAYTEPAAKNSDAIIAFDLDTGKMLWSFQDTKNDAWMHGCEPESPGENCPKEVGPDWDYGASPILRTLPDGRQVLVAASKSGNVVALDPDKKGALIWKTRLAEKQPGTRGLIVFGAAADERTAYFALNQVRALAALNLATGERKWIAPLKMADFPDRPFVFGASAAVTAIPGVVFSGGWDGVLRALSDEDGRVLWEYDTMREFTTVNGVAAKGGSMGAPGPTVAGGMVFVGSGYVGAIGGFPGNVLLAFSPE